MNITSELQIEKDLIEQLSRGPINNISQWTYRGNIKNEEDLWDNFKKILENNNLSKLENEKKEIVHLTDNEFKQIKNQLNFASPYKASEWLAGEQGIAKISVQREDAKLGKVHLSVFWANEVAGGHSSYEIVNQIIRERSNEIDRNRRTDVTLLINGLPMIHIELKNANEGYSNAFNQINKYMKEDKFKGIYSSLQMFVVSNGVDTRYIAPAVSMKKEFLSTWVSFDNQPISRLKDFTKEVLTIPQAHKMVSQYTVLDKSNSSLILLRPYQIHAIEAVKAASREGKNGYVWHTTGSGKTLTSYKVAKNLLLIPAIKKTIFIIDRVDLDNQTSEAFKSYAENDVVDVDNTENIKDLQKKLLSVEKAIVVTTIQKLNFLFKSLEKKKDKNAVTFQKLRDLKVVFVVDECHRAISYMKQKEMKKYFPKSLWYGFTGTPIFDEENKIIKFESDKGASNRQKISVTTEAQYGNGSGKALHTYTIKEAIDNKAVLEFKYSNKNIIENLDEIIDDLHKHGKISDEKYQELQCGNDVAEQEKERIVQEKRRDIYDKDQYKEEVANYIINKSKVLFSLGKGHGEAFSAILTTSSIKRAQSYYDLFMKIKKGESSVKISDNIKKLAPDFPRVAITYSISENEEESIENQEHMKKVLEDYNDYFNKRFTMEEIAQYNRDVNDRLARKKDRYKSRYEQLDLVIVVDRLLTGFDAPCISTLFIDRPPMRFHSLIQAFSRTNRIYPEKQFGNIVSFQQPYTFKFNLDEALSLYSNGGEASAIALPWDEIAEYLVEAIEQLIKVAPNPNIIRIPDSGFVSLEEIEGLRKFVKSYQTFDRNYGLARGYPELEDDDGYPKDDSIKEVRDCQTINNHEMEIYIGKYNNIVAYLKGLKGTVSSDPDEEEQIDAEYEINQISENIINQQYILQLIENVISTGDIKTYYDKDIHLNHEITSYEEGVVNSYNEIDAYINELKTRNEKQAELFADLWKDIKSNQEKYQGKRIEQCFNQSVHNYIAMECEKFSNEWKVNEDDLSYAVNNWRCDLDEDVKQYGEDKLMNSADFESYRLSSDTPVKKLAYRKEMKKALEDMMKEEIIPLIKK